MRTRTTDHTPEAMPTVTEYPDRNAALAGADAWIDRHRRHGCQVEWMPHGRIIARHHRMPVAAVCIVELAEPAADPARPVHPSDLATRTTNAERLAAH